jgi:hypothetical protein
MRSANGCHASPGTRVAYGAVADDLLYRYARPSSLGPGGIELATSGETVAPEPYLRGFLERPDEGAAAMPCVERTRLHAPPGSAAHGDLDPVVTREPGALRCESLSAGAACTRASTSHVKGRLSRRSRRGRSTSTSTRRCAAGDP